MNISRILLSAIIAASLVACNEKSSNTTVIISTENETITTPDTIAMNQYTNSNEVEVNGNMYNYSYEFTPSKSLPIVTNSSDRKYYDNQIKLSITKDGNVIYSTTFTKATFKNFIPEEIYETIVLMGFNFNYNKEDEHDKFYFVASIGDPDDEEYYIPIDISITTNGDLTLNKFIDTENGLSSTTISTNPL